MKRLLILMLLCAPIVFAQDHTAAMQDLPNTFSATNQFQGQLFTSLVQYNVASLPIASTQQPGVLVIVLDGTSSADCAVGGGSTRAICRNTGSIWEPLGGGGGGGGSPGGSNNTLQFNNASSFGGAPGITTPDGNSLAMKGTDPWADITAPAFGAKNVGITVYPVTTATCAGTSTACTVASAVFNNGDGIAIVGAGATETMSTPGAPTVVASLPTTSTVPEAPSFTGVNSPTGSTPYKYKVIAADQNGGLTLPSSATTYASGLATLGLNTLTLASCSRSNTTVTCTTTGTQNLAAGALVHTYGLSNAQFEGYFNVATANNGANTFTITNTPMDTRLGAATSATGGSVGYFTSNKLTWTAVAGAWEYYVCASRPADSGAYHLIGTTMPTGQNGGKYTISSYFDFGATFNGNQVYPPYVSDATCTAGSTQNDILSTTVSSGGGSTSIVLSTPTTNAVTASRAVYDAVPAIKAAIQSITAQSPAFTGGTVYFPPSPDNGQVYGYPINSYFKVPTNIHIQQAGHLFVNATMEFGNNVTWDGGMGSDDNVGFAPSGGATVYCMFANPCIYGNNANNGLYQNLNLQSVDANGGGTGANGSTIWLTDDAYSNSWRNVSFADFSPTNYSGKAVVIRSTNSVGPTAFMDQVNFNMGPTFSEDASWAPVIYFPIALNSSQAAVDATSILRMQDSPMAFRGIEWDLAGGSWDIRINGTHRQGPGMSPFLTLGNYSGLPTGLISLAHIELDSEIQPLVANLFGLGGGPNAAEITISHVISAGFGTGGVPPMISGSKPSVVNYDQSFGTYTQGTGAETHDQNGISTSNLNDSSLAISSSVCTDGSRNLTTSGCTGGGGSGTVTSSGTPTNGQFPLWTTSTNLLGTSSPENIYYADLQAGANCGAKINAADAALSTNAGEIWVNLNCGTSTWSAVTLSANHRIKMIQGGNYTVGTIRLNSGSGIVADAESGGDSGNVIFSFAPSSGTAIASANQSVTANAVTLKGFALNCTAGAANTAIGLDSSGISNSTGSGISIYDCGTEHFANGGVAGSTVYDNWDNMSYGASSSSSGFKGVFLESSANDQHWKNARFSRLATQMTLGAAGTATDHIDCVGCTFESADTMAVDVVNAFGNTLAWPRFEGLVLGVKLEAVTSNQIRTILPYWATVTTNWTDLSTTNGYSEDAAFIGTPLADSIPFFTIAGSGGSDLHTVLNNVPAPTANGTYQLVEQVTGGVAVAPTLTLTGLASRGVTGTTDTILYSDNNGNVEYTGTSAVAVTLPTPTTLGNPNFITLLTNYTNKSVTITPTTFTVSLNGGTAGSSAICYPTQKCSIVLDPLTASQWDMQSSGNPLVASLTTTAAASDNVTVTGMTTGGHCTFSPTNASAATNIATVYISAKAANQITVTHTATASMTYDIVCTVY